MWVQKIFAPNTDTSGENVLFLDNLNCQTTEAFLNCCYRIAETIAYTLPLQETKYLFEAVSVAEISTNPYVFTRIDWHRLGGSALRCRLM